MELTAEIKAQAEAAKNEANKLFKEKHYALAVEGYTKAIELDSTNAIYFGNRSFAHIKLEEYGSAVEDATQAIELDPNYVKGYYRRGDSYLALGKFKLALKDLKTAAKAAPRDADLRRKLSECEKEVKRLKFEEALASPELSLLVTPTVDLASMPVEDSYSGPRMDGDNSSGYSISLPFVEAMMEEFRQQRLVHKRFAFEIVMQAQALLRQLPSLVDVDVPDGRHITVCGDVHGQYYDLLNIFKLNGMPSADNPYLFNGDFVDRGSFSVEVILTLLALKLADPSCMHLTRGNHESKSMNKMYGFDGEVKHKYNATLCEVFHETFQWLPLAYVLKGKVMVTHGGLFSSPEPPSLAELRSIQRDREPPEEGHMCEMLWSDPHPEPGLHSSKRGTGVQFGPDITRAFLDKNGLELVVRSHEVKEEGYEVMHGGLLVTVFSAPNYCDQMGNKGAFIRFNGSDMVPHFTTFTAVEHPDVKPMAYASNLLWGLGM